MTPEGKESIRQEIARYVLGTASEWMRLVDLHVDPSMGRLAPDDDWQYRVSWEFPTDDAAVIVVEEIDHTEVARFGVTISVETLPDLPPIGPENDPALAHQDRGCVAEHAGVDTCEWCEPPPAWLPATFADLLPGDQVRIGTTEATVMKAHRGDWHAKGREWIDDAGKTRDHMTPWEHEELRIDLTANPGMHAYPPDLACEVLVDAERAAVLALQRGFSGSTVVSS